MCVYVCVCVLSILKSYIIWNIVIFIKIAILL